MNLKTERLLKDFREPDEIGDVGYVLDRLRVREENPILFRQLKEAHEARVREERDRVFARDAFIRGGGDAKDFDASWKEITTEQRTSKIREAQRAASESMWAMTKGRF